MRTSVILSTYNGAPYIIEQLDSLKNQIRKADEVIIIDDCSTDETCCIIKNYIEKNSLSNWKLTVNVSNEGWKLNFIHGMECATGDILFPCDQDDIWHLDKIEKMTGIMEQHSDITVLEGQPHIFFTEKSKSLNKTNIRLEIGNILDKRAAKKRKCNNSGKIELKMFNNTLMRRAPGCTLAIRKTFFDSILPEWFEEMPHDALVTYYSNLLKGYYIYDKEVIDWRQHIGSASRPKERNKKRRINEILLDEKMIDSLLQYAISSNIEMSRIEVLKQCKHWNELRKKLVQERRIKCSIKLLKYRGFYLQKRRFFTDIRYGMKK